jgi:hypothetical protein
MPDGQFLADMLDKQRTKRKFQGQPIMMTRKFESGDIEELVRVVIQNQAIN